MIGQVHDAAGSVVQLYSMKLDTTAVSDEVECSTDELLTAREELLRVVQEHPDRNRGAVTQALSIVSAELQRRSDQ